MNEIRQFEDNPWYENEFPDIQKDNASYPLLSQAWKQRCKTVQR